MKTTITEGKPSLAELPLLKNNPTDCFLSHPFKTTLPKEFR